MKITDPIKYMQLGGRIRYLANVTAGNPIIGDNLILDNLTWLKEDLIYTGFKVTLNLFDRKLGELEETFIYLRDIDNLENVDNQLSAEQAQKLSSGVFILEETLYCEAQEQIIASPVPRRFTLDHLLNNQGHILGRGVYESLTDMAKYDLVYSCKSIAFECPTASAFHILRCIEECVRVLFKAYFPRKDWERPWGPLLNELIDKPKKPRPDETLLEHLNHLRKRFRNPTDHPEKVYEIEEAEDLVHLSVDVINRCMRDKKVKQT